MRGLLLPSLLAVAMVAAPAAAPSPAASEPLQLRYSRPVPGGTYGDTHASYPAADIFKACGADVVSPVRGTVVLVDRVDNWDPATDNPWARGGKSVAVKDAQGVRHYLAHFRGIKHALSVGDHVRRRERLGAMGSTGRASACHTHYGISRMCPRRDWWVRRGVVWPQRYLDAWRNGNMLSPKPAVRWFSATYRGECSSPDVIGAT